MTFKPNSRQLVLRRDTATGLTLVGWDTDLPVGRFVHIDLIGDFRENILPDSTSVFYEAYQSALRQACQENDSVVKQKAQQNLSKGWYRVPFNLAQQQDTMVADNFGNYAAAAMQFFYQLTQNQKRAWAVIHQDEVVHVRARYPQKEMDELTYQVWYHKQQNEMQELSGVLLEGNLLTCESGLWFEEIKE